MQIKLRYLTAFVIIVLIGFEIYLLYFNGLTIKEIQSPIVVSPTQNMQTELPLVVSKKLETNGWELVKDKKRVHYACAGDFDGNGEVDYCVVVKDVLHNNRIRIIILLGKGHQYQIIELDNKVLVNSSRSIEIVKTLFSGMEIKDSKNVSRKLKYDSILVSTGADYSMVYYWEGLKFNEFWVGGE